MSYSSTRQTLQERAARAQYRAFRCYALTMLFSDAFGIERTAADDWFNPLLNLDTRLFIDPFLLYDGESGEFVGSHRDVIRFFNYVLTLIAQSDGNTRSATWLQALMLLRLPEFE